MSYLMAPTKFEVEDEQNNNEVKDLPFPYKIIHVDPDANEQLLRDFTGEKTGFVQVGPKKYFFPSNYEKDAPYYYNFEVRPDDIWIVTFPRSGTTWTQEMVWLIANNLDYETATKLPLGERCPFLEFSTFFHNETKAIFLKENNFCEARMKMVEEITKKEHQHLVYRSGRRIIKTHLPFTLLPQNLLTAGCKVIYVARNPKDVIISFYHLNKLFRTQGYTGNLLGYWEYFKQNLQPWTPYWSHIQEGWERRNEPNLLFMFYENMNKNPRNGIKTVATFLGKHFNDAQLDILEEHLKIENFRQNPSVNLSDLKELGIVVMNNEHRFIRKGRNGAWKEELTEELNRKIDEWIQENLQYTDLRFPE